MPPEAIRQDRYDHVKYLIVSINWIISALDRYSEEDILEILSKIETEIKKLPIDEFVKPRLCDILWSPQLSLEISLRTGVQLLSDPRYIN